MHSLRTSLGKYQAGDNGRAAAAAKRTQRSDSERGLERSLKYEREQRVAALAMVAELRAQAARDHARMQALGVDVPQKRKCAGRAA